jgi:hypothetical protein
MSVVGGVMDAIAMTLRLESRGREERISPPICTEYAFGPSWKGPDLRIKTLSADQLLVQFIRNQAWFRQTWQIQVIRPLSQASPVTTGYEATKGKTQYRERNFTDSRAINIAIMHRGDKQRRIEVQLLLRSMTVFIGKNSSKVSRYSVIA